MAEPTPTNLYGTGGGIATPQTDVPMARAGVQANPNDFGAQVGEAEQKAGAEGTDIAQKWMGIQNETAQVGAESKYFSARGQLDGEFRSLTGEAVERARPEYVRQIEALRQQVGAELNPMARRAYDVTTVRANGFSINDANMYAAGQLKAAHRLAFAEGMDQSRLQGSDPSSYMDPKQEADTLGRMQHAAIGMNGGGIDPVQGMTVDQETGLPSFDDSIQGKHAKATYEQTFDHAKSLYFSDKYSDWSDKNPLQALQAYNAQKDNIPKEGQVLIETMMEPKIKEAQVNGVVKQTILDANMAHQQELYNPKPVSSANNLGNVKTKSGAADGTTDFVNPATPVDGVILTAKTLRDGYSGMTIAEIGPKWTGESKVKSDAWVQNASKASGIDPNAPINLNDPMVLSSLLKGVATAEKSPQDRAKFTDDIINQGAHAAIDGKQPQTSAPQKQSFGLNKDGTKLTFADWAATHKEEAYANADKYAQASMPGDLEMHNIARARASGMMEAAISSQGAQYKQDMQTVMRSIIGDDKNGPPKSYDDLVSDPKIRDIVNQLPTRDKSSQDFYNNIDRMISRQNKGDDDPENKGLGTNGLIDRARREIQNGTIPDEIALAKKYGNHDIDPNADYLTNKGFAALRPYFKDGGRNALSPNNAALVTSSMDSLKKQVMTGEDGKLDPIGMDKWNSALPLLQTLIDGAGNDPAKIAALTQPDSKDYLGNSIKGFIRPAIQQKIDMANFQKKMAGDEEQQGFFSSIFGTSKETQTQMDDQATKWKVYSDLKNETDPDKRAALLEHAYKMGYIKRRMIRPEVPVSQ